MRWKSWLIAGGLSAAMGAAAANGLAQERPGVPPRHAPPWETTHRSPQQWLEPIRNAPTPSAAVDAYANAAEQLRHDGAADHQYMHRMIDFGLPELAEFQAQRVAERRPRDGTARAVGAYMQARRGSDVEALRQIAVAADLSPGEPFVQRTAGQLVAWMDARMDKAQIPPDVLSSVESTRRRLRRNAGFNDAYWSAREEYRREWRSSAREPFGTFPSSLVSDPFDARWSERVQPDRPRRDRDDRRWSGD